MLLMSFPGQKQLIEMRWSGLLLGLNSAFLKAIECKQQDKTRIKRMAKNKESVDKAQEVRSFPRSFPLTQPQDSSGNR